MSLDHVPSPPLFIPPAGYRGLKVVHSFEELVTTRFGAGVNALCWQRTLSGDFREVVQRLGATDDMTTLDAARLRALALSPAGAAAVDVLLEDQRLLQAHGLAPILDCIHGYPREDEPGPVPLDVYSFHADSATVETDTYLCSYTEASSEAVRTEDALRCVDLPETRAQLLQLYGGPDDAGFADYLHENCYDLHYVAAPGARPFSFGLGNLWRIAVEYPGSPVPPCVHRAPETLPGQPPRLLLIS